MKNLRRRFNRWRWTYWRQLRGTGYWLFAIGTVLAILGMPGSVVGWFFLIGTLAMAMSQE